MVAVGVGMDVIKVAMSTSTGLQTITGDCKGNTPKAALVIATWGTTLGTLIDGWSSSRAITDGTSTKCASDIAGHAQLAAAHITSGHTTTTNLVAIWDPSTNLIDGTATFDSFIADGIKINVTDGPASGVELVIALFYGDDLSVNVGEITTSGTVNGTVSVTGLSFTPNALIGIGALNGFSGADTQCRPTFGVAAKTSSGGVQQTGWNLYERDTPTVAAQCGGAIRSDSVISRVALNDAGTLTDESQYSIDSWDAAGITIKTLTNGNTHILGYLLMQTGSSRAWVGNPSIDITTTGSVSLTDPGWKPQFLLAFGTGITSLNSNQSGGQVARVSVGVTANGTQGCAGVGSEDSSNPSDTESIDDSKLLNVSSDAAGTLYAISFTSFDATGFTLNRDTSTGTGKAFGFLAIEEDRKDPGWWDARSGHRWRRCLVRR